MNVLELGDSTIGWGSGIRESWGPLISLIDSVKIPLHELKWVKTEYTCPECGAHYFVVNGEIKHV